MEGEAASCLAETTTGDESRLGVPVVGDLAGVRFGALNNPPSALVAVTVLLLGPFIPVPGLR